LVKKASNPSYEEDGIAPSYYQPKKFLTGGTKSVNNQMPCRENSCPQIVVAINMANQFF